MYRIPSKVTHTFVGQFYVRKKRKDDLQFIEALSSHAVAISSHFSPRDSVFHGSSCYSVVSECVQVVPTLNQSSALGPIF